MSALIEAQEHMAHGAPEPVRANTVAKIDQLISRLDDGEQPAEAPSFDVRRLQTARFVLSTSPVDLQA